MLDTRQKIFNRATCIMSIVSILMTQCVRGFPLRTRIIFIVFQIITSIKFLSYLSSFMNSQRRIAEIRASRDFALAVIDSTNPLEVARLLRYPAEPIDLGNEYFKDYMEKYYRDQWRLLYLIYLINLSR